jgi:hypothetical protein
MRTPEFAEGKRANSSVIKMLYAREATTGPGGNSLFTGTGGICWPGGIAPNQYSIPRCKVFAHGV